MNFKWVTLRVKSVDESIAFYNGLLGLPVATRFGGQAGPDIAMMGKDDQAKVELLCDGTGAPENPGKGVSFGLEFEDVEALVAKLKEAGLEVAEPIAPNPHVKFYFVNDPDGYQIQLM